MKERGRENRQCFVHTTPDLLYLWFRVKNWNWNTTEGSERESEIVRVRVRDREHQRETGSVKEREPIGLPESFDTNFENLAGAAPARLAISRLTTKGQR